MSNRRYARLESLPEIGQEGIRKLNNAKVLVIGCGALGSLCAMYLAASGVGKICIADFDTIDISNLQRQLFFAQSQLGRLKADCLRNRMADLNNEISVDIYPKMITPVLAESLFPQYDIIIDGSDNPNTKLMTDHISDITHKPCIIAGVKGFEGQIITIVPGDIRYADIFGSNPPCSGFTPCSVAGVLGPAAGVAASIQAAEAIKFITKAGRLLSNRLVSFDLLNMKVDSISM